MNKTQDLAKVFAEFFREATYEDLPQKVIDESKNQLLDYMGVAIAGAAKPGANEVRELYLEFGGAEQATVWGANKKIPVPFAAQVNATHGHTLDFDDVHEDAIMHPGVVAIPTALALAEYKGKMTGKELILAIALSGDMINRMNLGLHPGKPLIPFGWHTTTLNGAMVSANLTSKILGLSLDQTLWAIGLGYHQTSGTNQAGSFAKRVGPGFAVRNGITSALLAGKGVTAAVNSMEDDWGFYHVFHGDDYIHEQIIADLGTVWESANISIKPYPCCRGTHNFVDAGIKLHDDYDIDPNQVEKIELECGAGTLPLLGSPLKIKTHPQTVPDAQFSIAWGVAAGLGMGQGTLKEYSDTEEGIHNPLIRMIADKIISIKHTEAMDIGKFEGAKVTVTMQDGQEYSVFLPKAKGTPEAPLTFDDVLAKYRGNIVYADRPVNPQNSERIIEIARSLDSVEDVRELNQLTQWV
jgi:2-methylcitrate dehydratase PrpD